MPPFWRRPEPKKPEPPKPEPQKPQHAQESQTPLKYANHKRGRKEIMLDSFELDTEAHTLVNEYMGLVNRHGSEAKIPPSLLQDVRRRADALRIKQDAIRKEYEESS